MSNVPKVVISDIDISYIRMVEIIIKFQLALIGACLPFLGIGFIIGYLLNK